MDTVRQVKGLLAGKLGMEVDHAGELVLLRGFRDERADLLGNHLVADGPAVLDGRDRGAEVDLRLGRQGLERVDHLLEVAGEILLVGPVVALGVVGAELDDDHVGLEREGVLPGEFVHIRIVAGVHHGAGAHAEVAHPVVVAEHRLHLGGITVDGTQVDAVTVSDAVADAGHADGTRLRGLEVVQPGREVGHHLVVVGEERHITIAVAAGRIDVQRAAVAGIAHRSVVGDAVRHGRDEVVVAREHDEGGRGDVAADLELVAVETDQLRLVLLVAEQAVQRALVRARAHRDHRIDQDLEVRAKLVRRVRSDRGGQVAAGGRAHDTDVVRVQAPDGGAVTHRAHRVLDVRERQAAVAVRDAVVDQGEGDAALIEERRPGSTLVGVGQHGVAATRAAHDTAAGRLLRQIHDHLGGAVGRQVQRELTRGLRPFGDGGLVERETGLRNGGQRGRQQQGYEEKLFHIGYHFRNISFPGGTAR